MSAVYHSLITSSMGVDRMDMSNSRNMALNADERATWRSRVLKANEDIEDVATRVSPWDRASSFVELFEPGKQTVKQSLTDEHILQLIAQHLQFYGLNGSLTTLTKEAKLEGVPEGLEESRLLYFLRQSFSDVESVFELVIDENEKEDNEVDLEDLLVNMELIEPEIMDDASESLNIWMEATSEKTITFENEEEGAIKAATFNKLVEKLTSPKNFDQRFVEMFLMTYQSFATPEALLSKLMERFEVPPDSPEAANLTLIQLRVGNVLQRWIANYNEDFNKDLAKKRDLFIEQLQNNENKAVVKLCSSLKNAIQKAIKDSDPSSIIRVFSDPPPDPKVNFRLVFSPKLNVIEDVDEEEIARQLCLIEFKLYTKIQASELLNQAWSKPKLKHRSMNVLKMIARFNAVSMWVATSILTTPKIKQRAKIMGKCIKIAEHLFNLNNFNGTMAVIAALNWSSVHRLRWTRKEVGPRLLQLMDDLEKDLSSDNSFKSYRAKIASLNPPCIPYLGVYLTDLTFIDENPDMVNGLINFSKRKLIHGVISKVQQFQDTYYNLQEIDQIASQLLRVSHLDEQTLYNLSLKREPRGAERNEIE